MTLSYRKDLLLSQYQTFSLTEKKINLPPKILHFFYITGGGTLGGGGEFMGAEGGGGILPESITHSQFIIGSSGLRGRGWVGFT